MDVGLKSNTLPTHNTGLEQNQSTTPIPMDCTNTNVQHRYQWSVAKLVYNTDTNGLYQNNVQQYERKQ